MYLKITKCEHNLNQWWYFLHFRTIIIYTLNFQMKYFFVFVFLSHYIRCSVQSDTVDSVWRFLTTWLCLISDIIRIHMLIIMESSGGPPQQLNGLRRTKYRRFSYLSRALMLFNCKFIRHIESFVGDGNILLDGGKKATKSRLTFDTLLTRRKIVTKNKYLINNLSLCLVNNLY